MMPMRRKVVTALLCLFAGLLSLQATASNRPSIAVYAPLVMPGGNVLMDMGFDTGEITRRLEEALRATRRFSVFERNSQVLTSSVLGEQDLSQSDLAQSDAAQFGQLNNVGLIVQPIVVEFEFGSSFEPAVDQIGTYQQIDIGRISLTCKVLDTTSGEIKYQVTIDESLSREPQLVQDKTGGPGVRDWVELATATSQRSAAVIVNAIFPITVIRYENKRLFLNRGKGGGIGVGDLLELLSTGESLIDPVTKEDLGPAEFFIGKVRIIRVNPKFSVAEPVEEFEVEPKTGDVVRHAQ